MPITPFIGVRISWLMLARNSLFAWLATCAICAMRFGRSLLACSSRVRSRRPRSAATSRSCSSSDMFWRTTASTMTTAAPPRGELHGAQDIRAPPRRSRGLTTAAAIVNSGIRRSSASQRRSHAGSGSTFVCHMRCAVTDRQREHREPEVQPCARSRHAHVDIRIPHHPHDAVAEHRDQQQDPARVRTQAQRRRHHDGHADRREQQNRIDDQHAEIHRIHRSLTRQVQIEREREQHERQRDHVEQEGPQLQPPVSCADVAIRPIRQQGTEQRGTAVAELGQAAAGESAVVVDEIADCGEGEADREPAPRGAIGTFERAATPEPGNDRGSDIGHRPVQAIENVRQPADRRWSGSQPPAHRSPRSPRPGVVRRDAAGRRCEDGSSSVSLTTNAPQSEESRCDGVAGVVA